MKKAILFLLLLLISPTIFAQDYSKWDGFIVAKLSKETFDVNEEITGTIEINNLENYPIQNGKIVLHIAQGTYFFPSHKAINDNIVYQTTIKDIWVLPNSSKIINFNLTNPGGGEYRIDAYSQIGKTELFGFNGTLKNPVSKSFSVNGDIVERAIILRDESYFENYVFGQNGFFVEEEKNVLGKLKIKNNTSVEKKDLILKLLVCENDYSYCETELVETIPIGTISAGSEKEIDLSLISPKNASIYEINMELSENEKIQSIYKSQMIVLGKKAVIHKIGFLNFNNTKNENYTFDISVSQINDISQINEIKENSIDELNIKVEVFNDDLKIEEKNELIGTLDSKNQITKNMEINKKDFDKLCFTLENNSQVFDKECFKSNVQEMIEEYSRINPEIVKVNWVYNEPNNILTVNLKKEIINCRVIIISGEKILFEETINNKLKNHSMDFVIPKQSSLLIIDDLDSKKQQVINLILDSAVDLSNKSEIIPESKKIICDANLCKQNEVCKGNGFISMEGLCCVGTCGPEVVFIEELTIPLIFIIAIILLVIAIFILKSTFKKVKK
ncbi:MAG TPA: hypothetical protein PKK60_00295 [archaeon]|nr:hypothetical protein [archaeon]